MLLKSALLLLLVTSFPGCASGTDSDCMVTRSIDSPSTCLVEATCGNQVEEQMFCVCGEDACMCFFHGHTNGMVIWGTNPTPCELDDEALSIVLRKRD